MSRDADAGRAGRAGRPHPVDPSWPAEIIRR